MQLTKSVKRESLTLIAIISDLCSPNLRGRKPVVARGTGCTPSSIRPGVPKRQFPLTPALSPRPQGEGELQAALNWNFSTCFCDPEKFGRFTCQWFGNFF